MVQVDLPGAFAIGQIFAILSKTYLKKEKRLFRHRLMGPVSTYFSIMFAPVGLFLLICWPGWENMYWWEWVEKPASNPLVSFFYIGFYMAMIVIGCASYMLSHTLYRKGKDQAVNWLCITSIIVSILPFFLWPFTWYHVGTYAQYHAVPKQTGTLFNTPAFLYSWLIMVVYFVVTLVGFSFWLKKTAKITEG